MTAVPAAAMAMPAANITGTPKACTSCPPVKFPCFYGIDFASRGELIAAKYSLPEITKMLDVDSLHYLSIDGLLRSVMQSDSYCLACFDGNYPVPCRESGKLRLECGGCCGSR